MRKRAKRADGKSQIATFREIWEKASLVGPPVSEISGSELVSIPTDWSDRAWVSLWVSQFSHLLPKGSYRKFKYDPDNIALITADEHWLWHNESREKLERGDHGNADDWKEMFNRRDQLRNKANGIA